MDVITAINENVLTVDENMQLREQFIAESCELHFDQNPLKIVRSRDQYLYDDVGNKYLDFVSRITNVGHCNERVVMAACDQMQRFITPMGEETINLQQKYTRQLLDTLPSKFEVVLFTNSGTEANDLAMQMVRNYTGSEHIVVVDGAFHGIGNLLLDISPRVFQHTSEEKKPWVHVIPVPDTFRGLYKKDDPEAAEKYFEEAKKVITNTTSKGIKIGGLICEPLFVVNGLLIPPSEWLHKLISYIHELGGLVVADEIQCGMGRPGKTFWAFQDHEDAIPDILTVGKPMGNGYPIGAVITTRQIASTVENAETIYCCDPVGASVGLTVLEVMHTNKLMDNAVNMGKLLVDGFMALQQIHQYIGDVRGKGIIVAVDIVRSKGSTKPAPEIAEDISNRMREERILVGCDGEYKNILLFLSALCITEEDCQYTINTLGMILTSIEFSNSEEIFNFITAPDDPGPSTRHFRQCFEVLFPFFKSQHRRRGTAPQNEYEIKNGQYIPASHLTNLYDDRDSDDSEQLPNPYDALD